MVVETGKLDMEVLKEKENLSDDDYAAIQAKVLADEAASEGEKPPVKKEDQQEVKKEEHEGETAEEKSAREEQERKDAEAEAEKVAAENKRLLEAKEEDLNDEEKTTRQALIKADEDARTAKEAEDKKLKDQLEVEVKAYAEEHKISEDEARTDFESREKILEKYKSDPKQLALANLHLQRMYTKSQESLKAAEEAKPLKSAKELTTEDYLKLFDDGQIKIKDKVISREDAISIYREQFPDISENLEDAAILKLVAKELKEGYTKNQEKALANLANSAKEKRATVIASLPEAAKKYIPELQPLIEKYPDRAIMSEQFDINDLVNFVKGKHYDQDLKEQGEKEYKRGLAQAKIIGLKPGPGGQGSQKSKPNASKVSLNERQKKEALDMYDGTTFSDEEKYAKYAAVMKIGEEKK